MAFEYALKQLEVKPSEAVFIGDNLRADYEGAEKAGMIPILIKRRSFSTKRLFTEVCSELSPATRTIKALDEVFEVLKALNP